MPQAFISYSSRYTPWAATLHQNLERSLKHSGSDLELFFDQKDLKSGTSWVGRLEQGIGSVEQLILIWTPEALASDWVMKETRSFLAERGPARRLHIVHLVEAPLPPFLADIQFVDFREHDEVQ